MVLRRLNFKPRRQRPIEHDPPFLRHDGAPQDPPLAFVYHGARERGLGILHIDRQMRGRRHDFGGEYHAGTSLTSTPSRPTTAATDCGVKPALTNDPAAREIPEMSPALIEAKSRAASGWSLA